MVRAYSIDLRERVVAAMALGSSARTAALQFGVSVASAVRWSQRQRRTGGVKPGKLGGHRKPVLLPEREWLLGRIAAEPDLTLRGLLGELADRGVKASYGALWLFLEREGLSFKKSLFASEQDRPAIARRPTQWRKWECQDFRVWTGIMGKKDSQYVTTQRPRYSQRASGPAVGGRSSGFRL